MSRSFLTKIINCYKILSIVLLNVVIFLLLLNYVASVGIKAFEASSSGAEKQFGLFKYKEFNPILAPVYPNLQPSEVDRLLKETRSVSLGYEPYVQFRERPYSGKFVNVFPQGFRPVKNQGGWPPNSEDINIFIFGGSTVFGYGVEDSETIASFLQQQLVLRSGKSVRVFNFGRCSYIFPQEVVFLERLLASQFVPKIAIFIDGLNDFAHYNGLPGFTKDLTRFMEDGDEAPLKRWVADWPLIKLIRSHSSTQKTSPEISDDEVLKAVRERYLANKKVAEQLTSGFGVKPLFVWQPVPVYKYDEDYNIFKDFNYDRFLPYLRSGYLGMSRENQAGRFGSNFLWLADMQLDLKEPLYVDAVHYSARMCEMMACRISEKIIQEGLID
ncbi:MAG: SGNH/GDSL hydrolase family protein [Syntrophaceae bacterium]|nr:SGNH/GDSL hydrolase family protein [Syntrophaceae bacterium]